MCRFILVRKFIFTSKATDEFRKATDRINPVIFLEQVFHRSADIVLSSSALALVLLESRARLENGLGWKARADGALGRFGK